MGAGDLNMKKSWHPLLHRNQERVWKHEQEALAERRKVQELRKEREQERQMQELQRIHEEAGGKRRVERLDWMYATPATKSGPSESELEDYLLGKKRVDKLLQGNEAEELTRSSEPGFMAVQNANTARDTAAKVREDPLLAIKQQEQTVYEMLMKDPTRLRQMQARLGMEPSSERSERGERRHRHRDSRHADRAHRHDDRRSRHHGDGHRSRHRDDRYYDDERRHRHSDGRDRERDDWERHRARRHDREHRPSSHESREADRAPSRYGHRSADRYPERPPHARSPPAAMDDAAREAKLAEMMGNAQQLSSSRSARVEKVIEQEKRELEEDERRRSHAHDAKAWKEGGGTGQASFLLDQQRNLYGESSGGMDLHERLRRGRRGLERLPADAT